VSYLELQKDKLGKHISAFQYEGEHKSLRIRELKRVLKEERKKGQANAGASKKLERIKEQLGWTCQPVVDNPVPAENEAVAGSAPADPTLVKGISDAATAMVEKRPLSHQDDLVNTMPSVARFDRALAALKADEGQDGEINELDEESWMMFGHGAEILTDRIDKMVRNASMRKSQVNEDEGSQYIGLEMAKCEGQRIRHSISKTIFSGKRDHL
jgi:hypothetical protein